MAEFLKSKSEHHFLLIRREISKSELHFYLSGGRFHWNLPLVRNLPLRFEISVFFSFSARYSVLYMPRSGGDCPGDFCCKSKKTLNWFCWKSTLFDVRYTFHALEKAHCYINPLENQQFLKILLFKISPYLGENQHTRRKNTEIKKKTKL